jgi:DNA repair protein RadA/Sms
MWRSQRTVDPRTVLIGEVGLGGQVRPVSQLDLRLKEAAKLGFKRAIIPNIQVTQDYGLELVPVGKVIDAIIAALPRTVSSSFEESEPLS